MKIKGRKRHILVDTQGFLLKARVHAASVSDSAGGQLLQAGLDGRFPRLHLLWIDSGYKAAFRQWVEAQLKWRVECIKHPVEPRGDYAQLLRAFWRCRLREAL